MSSCQSGASLPNGEKATAARDRSVSDLLQWANGRLENQSDSPELDSELLLACVLGKARSRLIAYPEDNVPTDRGQRFRELIERRAAGWPVAYLTGTREFYSLPLRVTPATLVPRPETELLVDRVLEGLAPDAPAAVLDAGTGCGAIACAIKRQRPRCLVAGADLSGPALRIASANGERLGLQVHWIRSNWFDGFANGRFNVIACNPPYVPRGDSALAGPGLRLEPLCALDGGADGLESLRVVIASAPRVLAPGGTLVLEHGFDQSAAVRNLLEARGFRGIETHRDLAGHDRISLGRLQ